MEIREIREISEIKEINEYRGVKESDCVPKARKPSLNSLISLNSLSPHLRVHKVYRIFLYPIVCILTDALISAIARIRLISTSLSA